MAEKMLVGNPIPLLRCVSKILRNFIVKNDFAFFKQHYQGSEVKLLGHIVSEIIDKNYDDQAVGDNEI